MKAWDARRDFTGGLAELGELHRWLDELAGEGPLREAATLGRVRLALAEAFANAALHAHGGEAGRAIGIRIWDTGEGWLRLEVRDEGRGFRLPEAGEASEEAERGRGLRILRQMAERVTYEDNTLGVWLRLPAGL